MGIKAECNIHLSPGLDNTIGMPIYLLPLAESGPQTALVSPTESGVINVPNIAGFSLQIPAGAAHFGDDGLTGVVGVTQVHQDKMPMPPPGGVSPRMTYTVQPPNVKFDPPAPISFPNVEALPPGAIAEIFSFDHDLETYVSRGTAHVSEDGLLVVSDPGVGIVKGGWHFIRPVRRPVTSFCDGKSGPCIDTNPNDCVDISGTFDTCAGKSCDTTKKQVCSICGESGTNVCDQNANCVQQQVKLGPFNPPSGSQISSQVYSSTISADIIYIPLCPPDVPYNAFAGVDPKVVIVDGVPIIVGEVTLDSNLTTLTITFRPGPAAARELVKFITITGLLQSPSTLKIVAQQSGTYELVAKIPGV